MKTDSEPEGIPSEPPRARFVITSIDEYERATARVAELSGCQMDPDRQRELDALTSAIMDWDKGHDDATSWS